MDKTLCDVVVIGGGPSGSLAATYLTQKGYDVVLLERAKHPRPHVGESLLPHVWRYCDEAGVSAKIEAEGFTKKAGGTVVWKDMISQVGFKDFGHTRPSLHVERDRFDHILLSHAAETGATVCEEVAVTNVDFRDETQPIVHYRHLTDRTTGAIACRFVVDASGQSSVIAKQLGTRVLDEGFRFASLWGYFDNSKYISTDGRSYPFERLSEIPTTTFVTWIPDSGDWGWVWHIPLRDKTSVGLILPVDQLKAAKTNGETWESYFLKKCAEIPYLKELLAEATYHENSVAGVQDYSYRSTQLAGPGYFLVGDAAGFIDPIFSAGVIIGMYSAYTAAWSIDRCFKNPERTAKYQTLYSKQLEGRLEVARSLALPGYRSGNHASELARAMVTFESKTEQELMATVSQMTTRADNFFHLIEDDNLDEAQFRKRRYRVLERLAI